MPKNFFSFVLYNNYASCLGFLLHLVHEQAAKGRMVCVVLYNNYASCLGFLLHLVHEQAAKGDEN